MSPLDPFGLIGQVLDGQFRVDKFVGEGGFSIVYRGHHLGLDEPIAIKCLKLPNALGSALVESFVRRFRDESRLHYRLSQGNLAIARSIASGTTMSPFTSALVPYMVLEWLEGRSMAQDFEVRRERGLTGRTLDETVKLLDSAALGLAYAHAQGVIHRDINPGNLFIATTRHGVQLKVLDFGVAKIVSDHALDMGPRAPTLGQIRIFAPAYGAPEQFDDAMGKVGAQTDVYSFAIILLEALRDKAVREGEHLGEFAAQALDPRLPTPRALGIPVGDAVEAAFARAVAMRASERPADVGELWGNLKHAMRDDAAGGRAPYAFDVPRSVAPSPDRPRSQDAAQGGRGVTADIPELPAVEVMGERHPPDPTSGSRDARHSGGSRQLHKTVRMELVAPPSLGATVPSGAQSGGARPLAATVALSGAGYVEGGGGTGGGLGATVPLASASKIKSTLVMARPTPLPPTARGAVDASSAATREASSPPGYGSAPDLRVPAAYDAPGSAYGPPPPINPPLLSTRVMPRPDSAQAGNATSAAPTAGVAKRGRLAFAIGLLIVVAAIATAFGWRRARATRAADTALTGGGTAGGATGVAASATSPSSGAAPAGGDAPPVGSAVEGSLERAHADDPALANPSSLAPPSAPLASATAASVPRATAFAGTSSNRSPATAPPTPATGSPAEPAPLAEPAPPQLTAPLDPRAFNPVAAKAALDVVDGILASCRHPGGKTGEGHITVTFANDGQVAHAVVDEPPFAGTPEGACVSSRMRLARVKAFNGPPGTLVYEFQIPR